eukprot:190732-Chlamydomonas_euryale.AAC.1
MEGRIRGLMACRCKAGRLPARSRLEGAYTPSSGALEMRRLNDPSRVACRAGRGRGQQASASSLSSFCAVAMGGEGGRSASRGRGGNRKVGNQPKPPLAASQLRRRPARGEGARRGAGGGVAWRSVARLLAAPRGCRVVSQGAAGACSCEASGRRQRTLPSGVDVTGPAATGPAGGSAAAVKRRANGVFPATPPSHFLRDTFHP